MEICSWLSDCIQERQSYLKTTQQSTCALLIRLRNNCKPQQRIMGNFSTNSFPAEMLVNMYSYCVMVKSMFCHVWKAAIVKSSHTTRSVKVLQRQQVVLQLIYIWYPVNICITVANIAMVITNTLLNIYQPFYYNTFIIIITSQLPSCKFFKLVKILQQSKLTIMYSLTADVS